MRARHICADQTYGRLLVSFPTAPLPVVSGFHKHHKICGEIIRQTTDQWHPCSLAQTLKPSACTPLFYAAYSLRNAGCCIHTHSLPAVLVTLLCEAAGSDVFEIERIEQIKGVPRGYDDADSKTKKGNLGYYDTLRVPIIENTAHEEDLKDTLERAIEAWPDTYAVLVRRHGM